MGVRSLGSLEGVRASWQVGTRHRGRNDDAAAAPAESTAKVGSTRCYQRAKGEASVRLLASRRRERQSIMSFSLAWRQITRISVKRDWSIPLAGNVKGMTVVGEGVGPAE